MHKLHRLTDSLTFIYPPLPPPAHFSLSVHIYVLDSSYIHYFGNSYLEFGGIDLSALNNITVRFQTQVAQGTIFYVDQGPANGDFFFMKLFILDGILRYAFCCNEEEAVTQISTLIRVDDGAAHIANIRQHLTPCEAELTLSGHQKIKSSASNYWLGHMIQSTNHIFTGGLPQHYRPSQKAEPFHNYTGCIEIIEMNNRRSFYTSDAITGRNVDQCRYTLHAIEVTTTSPSTLPTQSTTPETMSTTTAQAPTQTPALSKPQVCRDGVCRNGGTCHELQLPGGAVPSYTTVYIPSFDGTSYLKLQPLASLLQPSLPAAVKDDPVTLYLTVKTRTAQGTILYSEYSLSSYCMFECTTAL
ncbi:hypothetical protein INR49_009886 [Caranx melampygus]|nr:hypothetical protein INR49_009886 [Caranx melampygus]